MGSSAMTLSAAAASAVGLAAGYALDRRLGDPRRWHPVAGFGRLAQGLERHWYADRRETGVSYVGGAGRGGRGRGGGR